jgi:beta-lactamase regulating signal transducer with metallopeptidase domain
MIALWMLYLLGTSVLLALSARAAEDAMRSAGGGTRWIWLAALIASAFLPIATVATGGRLTGVLLSLGAVEEVVSPGALAGMLSESTGSAPASPLWRNTLAIADGLLLAMWVLVSLIVAAAYAMTWLRLRRARQVCRPDVIDGERVLLSRAWGPAAVGVRRPVVVIPEWLLAESAEVRRLILLHEREHVRAGDHAILALAPLIAIAMPWNIVLWWQLRRLRLAVEVDCDGRVLARGVEAGRYGALLIDVAGRARGGMLAPAMAASRSTLERRIVAMTASSPRHRVLRMFVSGAAAVVCLAIACDAPSPAELNQPRNGEVSEISNVLAGLSGVRYELDGRPVGRSAILRLAPESIYSVEVMKRVESGAAEVATGLVSVTSRAWARSNGLPERPASSSASAITDAPLALPADAVFELDGRRVDRATALAIAPASIDRVEVIKRRIAGPDAKHALNLVRITTKAST